MVLTPGRLNTCLGLNLQHFILLIMNPVKTALLFLLISSATELRAQTADEVIAKYISYIGGAERWKNIHSLVSSGTYNYGGLEFPFQAYSRSPDQYKFIVPFNGKYFAQAYDGKQGWKIDAFNGETKKTLLTGKPALAMMNEADVELESPFINYKAKGHKASLEGTDTLTGVIRFKIKLTRKNGDTETYMFNCNDYTLVEKTALSKNGEMKNSLLNTFYTDYHEVQGIRIPFVATSRADGQTILTITIKKIAINVPVADKEFTF